MARRTGSTNQDIEAAAPAPALPTTGGAFRRLASGELEPIEESAERARLAQEQPDAEAPPAPQPTTEE